MEPRGTCQADPVHSDPTPGDTIEKEFSPPAPSSTECELLGVTGMRSPECANRVHNALVSAPGVFYARVDLKTGVVSVVFDSRRVTLWELADRVAKAGEGTSHVYTAVPFPMWG